ncbi:hypothetical protein [Microcoleus sp. D2_18a_D3]|uniref:hypothetical protein n=1 Tax=Microcoleus sp. D2_18a_D3 TaxID=3055330 RepID=UPI002FCF8FBC
MAACILDAFGQLELAEQISLLAESCWEHLNESSPAINWRQETGGRRQEGAGGRRQEAGGKRQKEGERRQEAGGKRKKKGGRRKEPEEVFLQIGDAP